MTIPQDHVVENKIKWSTAEHLVSVTIEVEIAGQKLNDMTSPRYSKTEKVAAIKI